MRALALLSRTGDGAIALDSAGRLVGWNAAAERLFGFRRDEVLGRPCHEMLGCQDLQGHTLCPATCPLFHAIRQRTPWPPVDLVVRHRRGHTLEVSANVVLLPGNAEARALVLMRPLASGVVEGPPGSALWPAGESRPTEEPGPAHRMDLAVTMDRLLIATGADAAELFVTVPRGGQLVLAAHRGQAPRAFRQIVCFDRGQGYPGLVAQSGAPLMTLDLAHDDRYLRTLVKRQGFRFYLCVPVWGSSGLLGSLNIASRRHAETVAPHLPFVTHVAWHLGAALERQRLQAAALVAGQPFDPTADANDNLRRTADWALRMLIQAAAADCGALLLLDHASGDLQAVSEWKIPPRLHRMLARACTSSTCPAIAERRCVLPSDATWAEGPLCRAVQRETAMALCLPLEVGGQPLGAVLLGCQHAEPLPTRHLTFLHAAVQHVALMIHNALVAVREERAARMHAWRTSAAGADAPVAPVRSTVTPETEALAAGTDGVPFLDLRCLGQLTMFSDGRPVPPERFARRRALTLLKILLTRYGKQVHREELMELLWPDADPESANTLLNVVVHCLRHGLEPNAPGGRPSSFIRTSGEHYTFAAQSPHRLDSQEFVAAVRLGGQLEARGQGTEALEAYQKAITLYAGDFLEEERYSDWCALEREYLRESLLTALRRAAHLHVGEGNVAAAVACYRRALTTDATLEDVHRALMEALWRAGRRDEALRQYAECCAVLARELGVAPMPETAALRQQIIASSAAPVATTRA